jgi:flagellar basal-body rod protein FlgF
MSSIIDSVSLAMRRDQATVDQIAVNIANSNTPGFQAHLLGEVETTVDVSTGYERNERHGRLNSTGKATDLALEGNGYFVVSDGENLKLTRNGSFKLDENNYLVSASNAARVQGQNGDIQLSDGNFTVSPVGEIRVGEQIEDTILVVNSEDEIYGSERVSDPEMQSSAANSAEHSVRQGYLEASNVDATQEMIALMETQRHFTTTQKFYVALDSLLKTAISTLGK